MASDVDELEISKDNSINGISTKVIFTKDNGRKREEQKKNVI